MSKVRLIPGTTIPYENWIQAWIVTNITKRKEIKEQKRREKNWSQKNHERKVFEGTPGCATRPWHGGYPDNKVNSYFTANVPDRRDLESDDWETELDNEWTPLPIGHDEEL
jgi:hypothetical protein